MKNIRIGAVSYLNTKPLVEGLAAADSKPNLDFESQFDLTFDLPSRLADQLAKGDLDVALIPSIEVLDDPGYVVVSDACIACRGPVWSVKFLSRVPFSEIKNVALDEGSRTSAAMSKIMLNQMGVNPEFHSLPISSDWRNSNADALLVIGDRAMHLDRADKTVASSPDADLNGDNFVQQFEHIVDLGDWWHKTTKLPFVFAMWTASSALSVHELNLVSDLLSASRDLGLARLELIAEHNAAEYGLTKSRCTSYLGENLHFVLGEQEKIALNTFFRKTTELGLSPSDRKVKFHDYQAVR